MKKLLVIAGAILALLLACGLLAIIFGDSTPNENEVTAVTEVEPTEQLIPTDEPAPTSEPPPTDIPPVEPTNQPVATESPADPETALRTALDTALGESNRDLGQKLNLFDIRSEEGSISVGWAANDNFSTNLIVGGMKLDTVEVLKAIDASSIPYEWIFIGSTFAMQDQFGNVDEMEVLTLAYKKETVDRINWDNFSFSNVFDVADTFVIHPVFQEE
jgi:hypothetical protein